jgi:phosphohistidine phosphatase
MNLLFWRHAEAEDLSGDGSDMNRVLTKKGQKQAREVAAWLEASLPKKIHVLASPSLRTQQTAHALKRPYTVVEALAPDLPVEAYLHAVFDPDGTELLSTQQDVLIVGHQPTIGLALANLLTASPQALSVKKGQLWWLSVDSLNQLASLPTTKATTARGDRKGLTKTASMPIAPSILELTKAIAKVKVVISPDYL